MAEPVSRTQRLQRVLSAHIRDPRQPAPPQIEPRRLRIYCELFYNNVDGCLCSAFPVLRELSEDAHWHRRVRDFYATHLSHAPQFHRLPEAFVEYLRAERPAEADDPAFLSELAHYEWVELALSISPLELPVEGVDPQGDLLQNAPWLSPLAWSLTYAFPVHRISEHYQPRVAPEQASWLVVNRDRQDRVRFLEVNAVTARLLALMQERPQASGQALLLQLADTLQHPQPQQVLEQGAIILRQLRDRDIVLGTRVAACSASGS